MPRIPTSGNSHRLLVLWWTAIPSYCWLLHWLARDHLHGQGYNYLLLHHCPSYHIQPIWSTRSDQGPQFMSQTFQKFSREWGFQDVTSSPTYPQSNGKAEPAVKLMKIIKGTWTGHQLDKRKLALSLLHYRNTPSRRDGASWHRSCFGSQFRTLYQHIILRLISQG